MGDQDPWLLATTALHQTLADRLVPHQFRVFPGTHEDRYWTANVVAYLEFYSDALLHDIAGG